MTDVVTTSEPWDRRDSETPQAYAALRIYLELGEKRSLERVVDASPSSRSSITKWSAKNAWVERAREWDTAQTKHAQHEIFGSHAQMRRSRRHAELLERHQETLAHVNVALLRRVAADPSLLDNLSVAEHVRLVIQGGRAMEYLVRAERLVRGMSTEVVAPVSPEEEALRTVTEWDDDRIDAFLAGAAAGARVGPLPDPDPDEGGDSA